MLRKTMIVLLTAAAIEWQARHTLATALPFCASCATVETDETAINIAVTINFFTVLFLVPLCICCLPRLDVPQSK